MRDVTRRIGEVAGFDRGAGRAARPRGRRGGDERHRARLPRARATATIELRFEDAGEELRIELVDDGVARRPARRAERGPRAATRASGARAASGMHLMGQIMDSVTFRAPRPAQRLLHGQAQAGAGRPRDDARRLPVPAGARRVPARGARAAAAQAHVRADLAARPHDDPRLLAQRRRDPRRRAADRDGGAAGRARRAVRRGGRGSVPPARVARPAGRRARGGSARGRRGGARSSPRPASPGRAARASRSSAPCAAPAARSRCSASARGPGGARSAARSGASSRASPPARRPRSRTGSSTRSCGGSTESLSVKVFQLHNLFDIGRELTGAPRRGGDRAARGHDGDGPVPRVALRPLPARGRRHAARSRTRAGCAPTRRRAALPPDDGAARGRGRRRVGALPEARCATRSRPRRFALVVPLAASGAGQRACWPSASGRRAVPSREEDLDFAAALARQAQAALERARLHRMRLEKERQDRELQIAREIQQSLFPRGAARASRASSSPRSAAPATRSGGDYFDFIPLDGRPARGGDRRRVREGHAGQHHDGVGARLAAGDGRHRAAGASCWSG